MDAFISKLPNNIRQKYLKQLPVPIIAIAHDLGLRVFESENFRETESGSIKKENSDFHIYVNEADPPARKRFTIAHEIAHFLLHRNYLKDIKEHVDEVKLPIGNGSLNRAKVSLQSQSQKKLEIEANKFAAELLMPEAAFKNAWDKANQIDDVAETFDVSPSAASFRAKELFGAIMV